jgi:hypothetical protein
VPDANTDKNTIRVCGQAAEPTLKIFSKRSIEKTKTRVMMSKKLQEPSREETT